MISAQQFELNRNGKAAGAEAQKVCYRRCVLRPSAIVTNAGGLASSAFPECARTSDGGLENLQKKP